jgi:hypothetical protein
MRLARSISAVEPNILLISIARLRRDSLNPLESCLDYFFRAAPEGDPRCAIFISELFVLFPEIVVPRATEFVGSLGPPFSRNIISYLNVTPSVHAAAVCCDFLRNIPVKERCKVAEFLRNLLTIVKIESGADFFSFSRFLNSVNGVSFSSLLNRQESGLSEVEKSSFEVKLCERNPRFLGDFVVKNPFQVWPVDDIDLSRYISSSDV